jgi:hypothetical protein
MERLFVAGIWIGACVSLMEAYPALALAQKRTIAVTQCLYSGPIGAMAGGAVGDPVRFDIDGDDRELLLIHKVQTNYDITNPFKTPIFAEKPSCRLKLDCVVSKQGLKDIGVQSTRQEGTGLHCTAVRPAAARGEGAHLSSLQRNEHGKTAV